jgi:prepilin-type N-terminal cleavage/methylation domain-containing protein
MNSPTLLQRGFSLIELMFSMAIGSIILILAAMMLGTSSNGYERINCRIASDREARAAINQLSSDLASAVFYPCEMNRKSVAAWPVDSLGFLSLKPKNAQTETGHIGDLCAVYYYIHDLTYGGKTVRCLMRGFHESYDTFEAMRDGDTASLFGPQFHLDEPIAFGVVSFTASPKQRNKVGKWIDWVVDDLVGPASFEIKIVIARRNLSAKLKDPTDWDDGGHTTVKLMGNPSQVVRNKDLEVYTTTLRFGNHGQR